MSDFLLMLNLKTENDVTYIGFFTRFGSAITILKIVQGYEFDLAGNWHLGGK